MSSDITVEATRLALGMQELRARVASTNIANASVAGASTRRMDFSSVQSALEAASAPQTSASDATGQMLATSADGLETLAVNDTANPIQADAEVADMVAAGTSYQALSEALSRHFGLMRLAIGGRN